MKLEFKNLINIEKKLKNLYLESFLEQNKTNIIIKNIFKQEKDGKSKK